MIAAHLVRILRAARRWLLPSPGSALFAILLVAAVTWAQAAGASPLGNLAAGTSISTVAYQGRLADGAGNPLTGTYAMVFRLYPVAEGGTPVWTEQWTGANPVRVTGGSFSVMLGSQTAIPQGILSGHNSLWLGISVGTDEEMTPRVQLGSAPFAMQALTVPDTSITTAKIANGAVTQAKLGADVSLAPPDGSITTTKLADAAVTRAKLSNPVFASNSPLIGETEDLTLDPAQYLPYTGLKHTITATVPSQVVIVGSATFFQWEGPTTELYASLYRNGTYMLMKYMNSVPMMSNWTWNLVDNVPPGTYTYQVYVRPTQPGVKARWMAPTISAIVIPKQ